MSPNTAPAPQDGRGFIAPLTPGQGLSPGQEVEPHGGFNFDPASVIEGNLAEAPTGTPASETELTSTAEALPAPEKPEPSDRLSTRLLLSLANKAETARNKTLNGAVSMSERRTPTELGKEKLDA